MCVTAIAAGASLFGAGASYDAARRSRRQGERAAEQERLATEERVRRLRLDRDATIGAQAAGAAAAGVDLSSGSVLSLQNETITEFERQIRFTRQAGAFAADAAETQGRTAAYANLATGLNSLANAVRIVDDAGGVRGLFGMKP